MARYFDSVLGDREEGALSTFNHDGFIEGQLDQMKAYTPSADLPASFLQRAGFVQNPDPQNSGTYVSPSRAMTEHYVRKEGQRQQMLQQQYQQTKDSTMFKVGDTLADTGRLFMSPLFWLSGEDTTKYDPSARLDAGYKTQMAASEQYRASMYQKLLTARDARKQQALVLQQQAYENSLPQSAQAKELRDFAMSTGPDNMALYSLKTPEAFDKLNKRRMLATDQAIALRSSSGGQIVIPKSLNETFTKYGEKFSRQVAPATEAFQALNKLRSALRQGTPLSEVAAVTQFNKVLDPGSVVRESEVRLTAEARGLYDTLMVRIQNVAEGDVLTDDQVTDMLKLSDDLEAVYIKSYNTIRDDAEFKFNNMGYNDKSVVRQYLGTRKKFTPSEITDPNVIPVNRRQPFGSGQGPLLPEFLDSSDELDDDLFLNALSKYYR